MELARRRGQDAVDAAATARRLKERRHDPATQRFGPVSTPESRPRRAGPLAILIRLAGDRGRRTSSP